MPSVSGGPWWGALACAAIPIAIGYLVDSMAGTELTMFFSVMFFMGCLAGILVVQNKSLFTAMVQPPLLMVIAVPLAYKTFAAGPTQGLKSLVLDMALPLIDRFPTMAFTTVVVWIVGAFRLTLYIQERHGKLSASGRRRAPRPTTRDPAMAQSSGGRQAAARQAPPRQAASRRAAASDLSATASPASPRGVDARRPDLGREAVSVPSPPSERRRSRQAPPRPAAEPLLENPRGARRPQPPGPDPREPERQSRPRVEDSPRTRSTRGHRYADEPPRTGQAPRSEQSGQRRRAEQPRQAEPPRRVEQPRRAPQAAKPRPPAPDEPSTGRRRLQQESVREFAERQGEVPRYRVARPKPERPATTEPDQEHGYVPRLPNVRYRD